MGPGNGAGPFSGGRVRNLTLVPSVVRDLQAGLRAVGGASCVGVAVAPSGFWKFIVSVPHTDLQFTGL